jgi:hypothetical protein
MLIAVCFFYNLQSCRLHFPRICTICQLTLSEGQVGTRAEVKEKTFPTFSLWMASNLCMSDCSALVLLSIRAVTFNWTSIVNMRKIIMGKSVPTVPTLCYCCDCVRMADICPEVTGKWSWWSKSNTSYVRSEKWGPHNISMKITVYRHVLQCTFIHSDQCCGRRVPSTLHPANRGSKFCREILTCLSRLSYFE